VKGTSVSVQAVADMGTDQFRPGSASAWNAPLDDPAAAHHAVAAAQEILVEIDRRDLADGAWPLWVGIGLHIGDAVTGNVGSPRRKEFTAGISP
jgi:adenylate cyclase